MLEIFQIHDFGQGQGQPLKARPIQGLTSLTQVWSESLFNKFTNYINCSNVLETNTARQCKVNYAEFQNVFNYKEAFSKV